MSGTLTNTKSKSNEHKFGHYELDSYADTIVAGSNCVILQYTVNECDVSPYLDDYESVSNVPMVHAATACRSTHIVQTYILVFNEVLWMVNHMDHSLINPNQLRHYVIKVQENSISESALSIVTEYNELCMGY